MLGRSHLSTVAIIYCLPNEVQGRDRKQLGQKLRRERGTSPIHAQLSQMAFRVPARYPNHPWKTPAADSLTTRKNNRSNTNTNTNTNTKTSQVLQDKKNNQSPNIWRKKEKMRAKYHPHSNIFGGNLTLSNFELGGRQLRTWDWARKNTFYMSSYPLYIWNGHVMCTISWGHKMCQLLNSFKLMGTDEHMGGPRATGNKFWLLWKRGSQLTLRFRSINMLLLLKPAPGYKLESLGSFDRLWFPVRKMVKGIK